MTARTRMILALVASLIICVLFYFFFIRPRTAELEQVRADVESEEQRTVQLQSELARLQDLQANAPKLEAELAEIKRLIPSEDHEIPNFIFLVQAAANASGVDFLQITPNLPEPPPEGATIAQVRITMSSTGSYFSLQDFIRRLYGLSRAVRLDVMSLGLADSDTGTTLSMNSEVRIFFEPPAPPEAPVAPGAPGAPGTPGATPAPTEPPEEG
ncbi:MAG TPA: type 4a pilus biogenesis protein PilO [Actinomycetota bacterium]|nr:type 4a pilus biogenesis protein PilO [Actinomycetota bacterium]